MELGGEQLGFLSLSRGSIPAFLGIRAPIQIWLLPGEEGQGRMGEMGVGGFVLGGMSAEARLFMVTHAWNPTI